MTEDHSSRISDLYRQSSQETPPAHVDRAVLDKARKSVRYQAFSPFGNHWIAGGAVAGVVMISVLLTLSVQQQPESDAPEQDTPVTLSEVLPEVKEESARSDAVLSELPAPAEAPPAASLASRARLQTTEKVQDTEAGLPEDETAARLEQQPATIAEKRVSTTATVPKETWYLQVGSFREQDHAVELQTRLSKLGFKSVIQEVSIENMDVYHRVRVGPFTDQDVLKQTKRKLDELGIGTLTVISRQ
ncbi:MAG: SPOR domain-containing protein [Gammaproteobacteria bacterium]|nr:MAG: SPOR domain-containing protein [Gammaproteobacteria bacterium]